MLGREFTNSLKNSSLYHLAAPSSNEVNIADFESVLTAIGQHRPEIVINCAALIQVDDIEANPEPAQAVNANGPANIAKALNELNLAAKLIHISTCDVFGQDKGFPFSEEAAPQPINAYGQTKLLGEKAIIESGQSINYAIVRTSWLYSEYRTTFVDKIIAGLRQNREVDAFTDQMGNPTYARHLARAAVENFIEKDFASGIYHLVNPVLESESQGISRYDFVCGLARMLNEPESMVKKAESAQILKAPRPKRAILLNTKLPQLPSCQEALSEFLRVKYGINSQ